MEHPEHEIIILNLKNWNSIEKPFRSAAFWSVLFPPSDRRRCIPWLSVERLPPDLRGSSARRPSSFQLGHQPVIFETFILNLWQLCPRTEGVESQSGVRIRIRIHSDPGKNSRIRIRSEKLGIRIRQVHKTKSVYTLWKWEWSPALAQRVTEGGFLWGFPSSYRTSYVLLQNLISTFKTYAKLFSFPVAPEKN